MEALSMVVANNHLSRRGHAEDALNYGSSAESNYFENVGAPAQPRQSIFCPSTCTYRLDWMLKALAEQ